MQFTVVVRKRLIVSRLVALLGLGAGSVLVEIALAPLVVQAATTQVSVSITHQVDETYPNMLRRAEDFAKAATQRSFNKNKSVTDVAVVVVGENHGFVVPILSLKVNRQGWKRHPNPRYWATYFPNTKVLLGFTNKGTSTSQTATSTTPVVPTPTPITTPTPTTQPTGATPPRTTPPGAAPPTPQAPGTNPASPTTPPGAAPPTPQAPGTNPATPTTSPGAAPPTGLPPGTNPSAPGTPGAAPPTPQAPGANPAQINR